MRYLKTNTATRITVGPFLDKTDGITPEVALTVTSCKLTLMVDTGGVPTLVLDVAPTASGGANDMVHVTNDDAGFYDLELAAADVNYIGNAMLAITDTATHCPVFHEFVILPSAVYDSILEHPIHDYSGMQFDPRVPAPYLDTMAPADMMANVYRWDGGRVAVPSTEGVPDVNVLDWKGATAPAMTGDAFARLGAPAGASIAADLVVIDNFVDDLETRITEARLSELDAGTPGKMAAEVDIIAVDVAGLDGAAMRGTDSAALASVCTEGRLAELDPANLPTDVADVVKTTTTIADGDTLGANTWLLWLRRLKWVLTGKLSVTDATGAFTLTKDDGTTSAGTGSITDDSTTTIRTVITWA